MTQLHKNKPFLWALFIILCCAWFYTLAPRTLVPTDEGRYAEMAREMALTGDWITPRLNGIKYFEKPPLQTWMNALTFRVFGLGEWQARLWTGLTGMLGVIAVAYAGRRVFNQRVGFIAAAVLASSFFWVAAAHFNTLDMGLSGMMTLTLCSLLLAQRNQASEKEERNWMLVCWASMALAVLSKGLIGIVLPGGVLVLYMLATRDWALWKRLHWKWGLLVFFAIATPWFVLVSIKNPEFPQFFFIHEHFQRYTSKVHRRAGPIYYFIPILVLGILPWLSVLGQSLWRARREPGKGFKPRRMLLIWSGFIFFFFSISGSKLPGYILPIFPALALLIGCYLQNARNRVLMWMAISVAVISAIGMFFAHKVPTLTDIPFERPLYEAYAPWVTAAAWIGLAGSLLAALLARMRLKDWSIVALAFTGFTVIQALMLGHEPLGNYFAGTNQLARIKSELTPEMRIYSVERYDQVLPVYLERTMTLVAYADEMAFGLKQQPELWLPTLDAYVAQLAKERAAGKKSLAILSDTAYQALQKQGVPMRVIGQDPRRVVVVNELKPS